LYIIIANRGLVEYAEETAKSMVDRLPKGFRNFWNFSSRKRNRNVRFILNMTLFPNLLHFF